MWNLYEASDGGDFTLSSDSTDVSFYQWNSEGNYTESTDIGNDMVVIIPTSVTEDFTVTAAQSDGDSVMTIEVRMIDNGTGGDVSDWMPEFTEDTNAAIEGFTKYTDLSPDATEYTNCLYFAAGTHANDGPDPENITVRVFGENGTILSHEYEVCEVDGTHQVKAIVLASVPDGTSEGDKFTAVATWTLDGVTYGVSTVYYWVD